MKPRFINLFRKTGRLSFDTAGETTAEAHRDENNRTTPKQSDNKDITHTSDIAVSIHETPAQEATKTVKCRFFEDSCPVILSGVNPGFWNE